MVYVPGFGILTDYLAIFANPLVHRLTARWAAAANYKRPLSRKEKRRLDKKRSDAETWWELGLTMKEVQDFVAEPYDRYALVSESFRKRHNLGSGNKGSVRKHAVRCSSGSCSSERGR